MDFLHPYVSTASLLCEESCESIFGFSDGEEEAPESNMDLDSSSFVDLYLKECSDDLVGSLMQQEKEQLACIATGDYLERLNNGGIESSWRAEAIEWFCKVQARHNFGPLFVYLAANYLDRFLASNLPDDKEWAYQVLSVVCLSIAAKMEETMDPPYAELEVCNVKQKFRVETIEKMEVFVLRSLNWRMNSVTPFSYISYFARKFNEGNPLTNERISCCTELILGTLKETKFLQFMPSEIAAAVVLYAVAENNVFDVSSALLSCQIPVDKEKVRRCREAITQQVALLEMSPSSRASPSVSKSPSDVLNASCFLSATDDSQTPGLSSEETNDSNANSYQPCTPVSKRKRLDQA